MISTEAALAALFALLRPTPLETMPLRQACGRVLAQPLRATRAQPPFASSAMDGYAVAHPDPGATLDVIGTSQAGHRFAGRVGPGQAVRIFTGAPVPEGASAVIIQEVVRRDGDRITLPATLDAGANIRAEGGDFQPGTEFPAPRRLTPADIALLAAMNCGHVTVHARPRVALISTGDELAMPGSTLGPDQIVASNALALAALLEDRAIGAQVQMLPIARDDAQALRQVLEMAQGADLVVPIGGASVGEHDLVGRVAAEMGLERSFYKVALRPGKPLMCGRLGDAVLVGLPGNPVSAMVCGHIFLRPALDALQGLPARALPRRLMPLAAPLPANGPREHYMRASLDAQGRVQVFDRQDSSLMQLLAAAQVLAVRAPDAPAAAAGDPVAVIDL